MPGSSRMSITAYNSSRVWEVGKRAGGCNPGDVPEVGHEGHAEGSGPSPCTRQRFVSFTSATTVSGGRSSGGSLTFSLNIAIGGGLNLTPYYCRLLGGMTRCHP